MRILHILRNPKDRTPLEIAEIQTREHYVGVLLLHDAVFLKEIPGNLEVYACLDDALARNISSNHTQLGYEEIVKLIFEYDKVVSW